MCVKDRVQKGPRPRYHCGLGWHLAFLKVRVFDYLFAFGCAESLLSGLLLVAVSGGRPRGSGGPASCGPWALEHKPGSCST